MQALQAVDALVARGAKLGPLLAAEVEALRGSTMESLRVLYDESYADVRVQYRRRLERNANGIAIFGSLWISMLAILVPDVSRCSAIFVGGLALTSILFPSRPNAMSWAILCFSILATGLCIAQYGESYFRYGITHSTMVASLMVFFAGFGASGAIVFSGACCAMWTMAASSSILALNIGVACAAQMVMCALLEVSFLHQLGEAKKSVDEMKAVEEQKANFMAIVSHELRSPLHGIIGLTSSLIANQVPKDASRTLEKHLKLVLNCAHRQLDMVNNIMDASMLVQEKRAMFSRDLVQLDCLVGEVIASSRHLVDRSGKKLLKDGVRLVNLLGTLPAIEADAQRCTQLIYNLISNALKFTESGRVAVHGEADAEARTVRLTVEDTGVGIAEESLESIFRPFSQEDESPERLYDGLGLGLSICKAVVAEHGGSLTVESIKGEGSKFHVVLPYAMKGRTSAVTGPDAGPVEAGREVSKVPSGSSTCASPLPAPRRELRKLPSGESSCLSESSCLVKSVSRTFDSEGGHCGCCCGRSDPGQATAAVPPAPAAPPTPPEEAWSPPLAQRQGPPFGSLLGGGSAGRGCGTPEDAPYQIPSGAGPPPPSEPPPPPRLPPDLPTFGSGTPDSAFACPGGLGGWDASRSIQQQGAGLPAGAYPAPTAPGLPEEPRRASARDVWSGDLQPLSSDTASRAQHLSRTPSVTTFSSFLPTPTGTQESLHPLQYDGTVSRDDVVKTGPAFAYPGVGGCSWWELRRQTAHQSLHIRHRWRDQAKMQVSIQQTFLLLQMLEKHPHLGDQAESPSYFLEAESRSYFLEAESRSYFLEEIQKRVTQQFSHLQEMRQDLAASQQALQNRMSIIQSLEPSQESFWWARQDNAGKPFDELKDQIARCASELKDQAKDMDKVEEELTQQREVLLRKVRSGDWPRP